MGKRKADTSGKTEVAQKKPKQTLQNSKSKLSSGDANKFSKNDKPPKTKFNKPDTQNGNEKSKFKTFQKGKVNKTGKFSSKTEKPADWNEFKKQKKELRLKRRQNKSLFEIVTKAKQIGETLRRKSLQGGKEERDKLVKELHQLLGGHCAKLVLTHDIARIIQYMLKFGNQKIREDVATEIIPSTVVILQSKYGRYCIKRIFKYGNAKTRSAAIKAMYGNIVKLTSHGVSARIFEYIYSTWTQPQEKFHLTQEFFGDLYKQAKDNNVKHLRDVYKDSPDMKVAALGAVKANLSRVLNKDLLDSGLIQTVLYQYLTECNGNDRNDLISQLSPHVVILSNSKDGSRVVMECIWHGTNKDRKVIMKALKEHVLELCTHEHGHTVLLAVFDAIDDTVLVNKTILPEILKNALDVAKDEWGRKVILWLVAPGHSTHFHPTFTNELEDGRQRSSSKKGADVRQKEILGYSSEILLNSIKENTNQWFENASMSVVALAILKTGTGPLLLETLEMVARLIVDSDWKIKEKDEDILGIEHAGLHMTLKKLIQNDRVAMKNEKATFSQPLVNCLEDRVIKTWLTTNRGCFLLISIVENGSEDVASVLKERLKNHLKLIKKEKSAGSRILLKLISV